MIAGTLPVVEVEAAVRAVKAAEEDAGMVGEGGQAATAAAVVMAVAAEVAAARTVATAAEVVAAKAAEKGRELPSTDLDIIKAHGGAHSHVTQAHGEGLRVSSASIRHL